MKKEVVTTIQALDEKVRDKWVTEHEQESTPVDTCFKWAPFALLMAYDLCGLKTRNNYKLHILQMIAGELMLNAAIQPIKKSFNRIRPNGKTKSFPSAHTATCSLASGIIYHELRESAPALRHSGYVLSIVTGGLRMYHKRHWLSDVVAGALIGSLFGKISTSLVEHLRRK